MTQYLDGNLSDNVSPHPINTFDIETTGSDNDFYMGSIVGDNTWGGEAEIYWDQTELLDALLSYRFKNGYIYAHNLEFDLMGTIRGKTDLIDGMGLDMDIFHNGSNIIYARFRDNNNHVWEFRDSYNIAPWMSVEDMGNIIDLPKLDMDLKNNDISDYSDDYVEWYNVRDSRIAYEWLSWFQDEINELGGNMEITSAKTAMNFFRRNYLDDMIKQPSPDILKMLYDGYYGGRVSPFTKGHIDGPIYCYDVASLYPYCMREASFPDTNSLRYDSDNGKYSQSEKRARIENKEGMSKVTIHAPEMHKPILPYRTKDKLLFPVGELRNTWLCHNEIRFACERGYEVESVGKQVWTANSFNPFENYVNDLFDKRLTFKRENNPTERIVKLLLNSLYGKFGQRIENEDGGEYKPIETMTIDELKGNQVVNGWVIESTDDSDYLPSYINPLIASYVTARGRLELYKWIETAESKGGDVFYCDTDSLYTNVTLDASDEKILGEMDYEGEFKDMWVFGPKMYVTNPVGDSEPKFTMKGVPGSQMSKLWNAIKEGEREIEYSRIAGMRESIRRGYKPNQEISDSRSINLDSPTKRVHFKVDDILHERVDTEAPTVTYPEGEDKPPHANLSLKSKR